jgi:Tfp pilus assembly protein PilE
MKNRWAPAFTVVELVVVITSIAIIAAISVVAYNAVQTQAQVRAAQADLSRTATEMQRVFQQTGSYPSTLPAGLTASNNRVTLSLVNSGTYTYYSNLTAVQNGALFSKICDDLLAEGVGKGVDQGGTTRDYVSGCGNWNYNNMQVTAWDTVKWDTPLTAAQLTNYAANYTVSTAYHKQSQEATIKNFYNSLVSRMQRQGGTFPITSFWDYWATPSNGGVMYQSIDANGQPRSFYCVQAAANNGKDVWKVDQTSKVSQGSCN